MKTSDETGLATTKQVYTYTIDSVVRVKLQGSKGGIVKGAGSNDRMAGNCLHLGDIWSKNEK